MKKWVAKAIIQKLISFLPASQHINYAFQKYITKGVVLSDDYLEDRLIHFEKHISFFKRFHTLPDFQALEIGTGWYPVIPLCYFLSGAEKVYTFDISRLCKKNNLKVLFQKLQPVIQSGRFEPHFQKEKIALFETTLNKLDELSLEEVLSKLNIHYKVGDVRHSGLTDQCIDLISSNNTFEHIYPEILGEILDEFKRIGKQDGIMSHFIDMSDHFAHLDPGINIYHFLKYSPTQWQRIDNSVQPQNRWRIYDFRDLYHTKELEILVEENRPGQPEALKESNIHPDFKKHPLEQTAISHSYIVSKFT